MQSLLEDSRSTHEEIDVFERRLTSLLIGLDRPNLSQREQLSNSHRAADLVSRIAGRSGALSSFYEPGNADREREIESLSGGGGETDALGEFYARLAKVKEYHRKYPDVAKELITGERVVDFSALESGGQDGDWLDRRFTGDEALGKYLDLHEQHEAWNNLSGGSTTGGWKRITYLQYLATFTSFEALSQPFKASPTYAAYLVSVLNYLTGFYERTVPLGDLDTILRAAESTFAPAWEAGTIPGWSAKGAAATSTNGTAVQKEDGIWCAACNKLYAKETVYNAHLTSKKHEKAAAKLAADGGAGSSAPAAANGSTAGSLDALREAKNRALALKESLITALAGKDGPLAQIRSDTLANTERRAALTDKERAAEIEELEAKEAAEAAAAALAREREDASLRPVEQDDDDDDEDRIYNPLKLPLGWDGKPIPFWLYKLHGLGVEYPCEICSDYVYRGRKAFERHFQESRHAFGMRALGLPNTKHFHEITKIEDAMALAKKLAIEGKQEQFQSETMEELEDSEGNVFDKKTYNDLQRQGLL